MTKVDQRSFSNQPKQYLEAREAARLLGVKVRTLYAYASGRRISSVPGEAGRKRRYLRADLERLKARAHARAGHAAVAADALRWGEPVLDTAISAIEPEGPVYRGRPALDLAASRTSFESVCELLWCGQLPSAPSTWRMERLGIDVARMAALIPRGSPPLVALSAAVPLLAAADEARFGAPLQQEWQRAR